MIASGSEFETNHAQPLRQRVPSHRRRAWLPAVALVLAGCGTGDSAGDADSRVTVSLKDVHVVGTAESDPASRYPGATRFLPYPLWTLCADGRVALYDPLENELRRLGENGRTSGAITLPEEQRLEVTADRLFTMVYRQLQEDVPAAQRPDSAELRRQFEPQINEFESQSAGTFPEYADLRCARDGTLWLQPFDVSSGRLGRGPDWYRISADGSRAFVSFPEQFTPFRFDADQVWGTLQDAMGVASVAWLGADALR